MAGLSSPWSPSIRISSVAKGLIVWFGTYRLVYQTISPPLCKQYRLFPGKQTYRLIRLVPHVYI